MPQDQRARVVHEVDAPVAVHVDQLHPFRALHVQRKRLHEHAGARIPTRQHGLRPLEQPVRRLIPLPVLGQQGFNGDGGVAGDGSGGHRHLLRFAPEHRTAGE